jgi:hypothetical protein
LAINENQVGIAAYLNNIDAPQSSACLYCFSFIHKNCKVMKAHFRQPKGCGLSHGTAHAGRLQF